MHKGSSERVLLDSQKEDGTAVFKNEESSLYFSNMLACSHINLLLGAGFSYGKVPTLGDREKWAERLEILDLEEREMAHNLISLELCRSIILPTLRAVPDSVHLRLCRDLRRLIQARGTITIPKRACIFTTNYDPIIELSLEEEGCSFNDGFEGRNNPRFETRSFDKLQYVQSLSMEYASQVPTINVIKLHGSVTWKRDVGDGGITYLTRDKVGHEIETEIDALSDILHEPLSVLSNEQNEESLRILLECIDDIDGATKGKLANFQRLYSSQFCIVNPNKKKFADTVLGLTYYELLRLYANELDRNNSLLIAFGFSFADEHIAEITRRALENPKLILIIFCHTKRDYASCSEIFPVEHNVRFVATESDNEEVTLDALCDLLEGVLR